MSGVFPGCDGLIAVAAPAITGRRRWPRPRFARPAGRWKSSWWKRPTSSPAWQNPPRPVDGGLRPGDRGPALAGDEEAGAEGCDLIVVNGPAAIEAARTQVEVLDPAARCWPPWPAASAAWREGFSASSPSGLSTSLTTCSESRAVGPLSLRERVRVRAVAIRVGLASLVPPTLLACVALLSKTEQRGSDRRRSY